MGKLTLVTIRTLPITVWILQAQGSLVAHGVFYQAFAHEENRKLAKKIKSLFYHVTALSANSLLLASSEVVESSPQPMLQLPRRAKVWKSEGWDHLR
tara:strand:- start:66 stop:356 length:291 start_codon:yes stop_codon:yes gene_type:complete